MFQLHSIYQKPVKALVPELCECALPQGKVGGHLFFIIFLFFYFDTFLHQSSYFVYCEVDFDEVMKIFVEMTHPR